MIRSFENWRPAPTLLKLKEYRPPEVLVVDRMVKSVPAALSRAGCTGVPLGD
jgi:hypothetical protein